MKERENYDMNYFESLEEHDYIKSYPTAQYTE